MTDLLQNNSEPKSEMSKDIFEEPGIIMLGNSGVGKSFLANILIGHEAFAHRFSAQSVTHETASVRAIINDLPFKVFNVPGLIEAEQERIDLNKIEIDKAFRERPNSVVIFVFGHQNGRIRDEDVVAFSAINAAYPFRPESLIIVVNGLLPDRPHTYEGTLLVLLQSLLRDSVSLDSNVCFLDHVDGNDTAGMEILKENLQKTIRNCTPMPHRKAQEIETRVDQLKLAQRKVRDDQTNFEVERAKFLDQLAEKQNSIDAINELKAEKDVFQRIIQQQQENLSQQAQQMLEDRELLTLQVRKMHMDLNQARRHYEDLRRNSITQPREVHRARSVFDELREAFAKLIFKGFFRIIGN